jgi:hypothetical protein
MGDQRALDAIARIERALARIEIAANRPAPAAAPTHDEDHERLREAHATLRRAVAGAIGQVDHLIEGRG